MKEPTIGDLCNHALLKLAKLKSALKQISLVEWDCENAEDRWWQMHTTAVDALKEKRGKK